MNSAWKIGVNSHASRSIGLAPGAAGASGAWRVASASAPREPPGAGGPGTHAATTSASADQEQDRRQPDEELP